MSQPEAHAPATEAARRLFAAIKDGDEGLVEAALNDGASVNSLDYSGSTSLMAAVINRRDRIIKLLQKRGADVNLRHVSSGMTPAFIAAHQ